MKTTKRNLLLGTLLSGAMLTSAAPSFAQDTAADEIVVTGSRIKRAIDDSPQPVTTISAVDIELSGITNVSDLLRTTTYNTFGSFRERSGSSFGQIATVNLKGIGSQYTAVLINGRRVPGSPLTGASIVDLNTIPLSAVENIEILKDSASAVYGADAIGGVVNITLKDDFDGFEIGGSIERPTLEGANSERFNVLWGKTFDRGNIIVGYENFSRDAVSDADREYSAAITDATTFGDTRGVSVGGNTAFETDFSGPFALGDCDTSVYAGVFDNPFGLGGTGCGFAYANISLQTGNLERDSVFLSGDFELNENAEIYIDGRYNSNSTSGRYAPAVGFFTFAEESPFNTFGRDIDVFHRFVGHGNRDDSTEVDEITLTAGVRGDFADSGIGYDAYVRYFDYSGDQFGNTYVQASVLEAEVAAGNYNALDPFSTDPIHLAAIENSGIELSRDLKTRDIEIGASLNGELNRWELGGGKIGWAAGVEYADQSYTDIYDEFREAVDVLGSAGNSAEGDRKRYAIFGETRFPITDSFEVNVAGRFDDYNDVGSEFSPQVSARWSITNNFKIRGSWGEGFKAPNLIDLFQQPAESFNNLTDFVFCDAAGISAADCPTVQVQNFSGGNEFLTPETSESFNVGAIADLGNFSISADYYNIEIKDQVSSLSLATINLREAAGELPPGVIVNRGAGIGGNPGAIIDIFNPSTNAANVTTSGIDIGANFGVETEYGDFSANATWVHVIEFDRQSTAEDPVEELAGSLGSPENRVSVGLRYARNGVTLSWNTTYIDSFSNAANNSVEPTGTYEDWMGHDVTVNFTDVFGFEGVDATAGVLNVFGEEPSIDSNSGYDAGIVLPLYEVRGSIPFVSLKYRFGE